jgi:hypothetical protein
VLLLRARVFKLPLCFRALALRLRARSPRLPTLTLPPHSAQLCVSTVVLVASLDKENFFASSKTSKR